MKRTVKPFVAAVLVATALGISSCGYSNPNSLPLPGTKGKGGFSVQIEMPDVTNLEQNSPVLVDDVNVGTVSKIERDGWHALVTVKLEDAVDLPANAVARVAQTSLLGSLHIALAAPMGEQPVGRLGQGSRIPLSRAGKYPTTEQTLSAVSFVLNGGGLAQLGAINQQLNAALNGHEDQARALIRNLDVFTRSLAAQQKQIIAATQSMDRLVATVNRRSAAVDGALVAIPPALEVLAGNTAEIRDAVMSIGEFANLADKVVTASGDDISTNLANIWPALRQLANAGPNLTKSMGLLLTFPWPQAGIKKFIRGDAGNLSATIDLTLGRADNSYLQMTEGDGRLTMLETLLGRTVGRQPTPKTRNPLTAPILRGGS
jgi:phospholipid/cholesterol/gamma-HCH transport system substrate-binding protein